MFPGGWEAIVVLAWDLSAGALSAAGGGVGWVDIQGVEGVAISFLRCHLWYVNVYDDMT